MSEWSFIKDIPWSAVTIGAVTIFVVAFAWIWLEQRVDPWRGTIDDPDASAFVRGKCGDSMKLSLRFLNDKVIDAKYWTDGCRMSSACGSAVAKLALLKTPEEIADIDYLTIEREVGGLPEEDLHCATLAAETLQEALKSYLQGLPLGRLDMMEIE
jgi:nitrogen fixation NifU-like protein